MTAVDIPNIVLWSVQGFLTLVFLFAGIPKLLGRGLDQWTGFAELPRVEVVFIGLTEVLGAAALVLPMAFMVMLERLSPIERAVLLLRDVFDFDYAEIAQIVDKSEANCRQLLTRAKKHMGAREARFEVDRAQADRLMQQFTEAASAGDMEGLLAVLAEDITLWADGGGKAKGAALRPIHGADAVARFSAGVIKHFVPAERVLRPTRVNGEPGFIVYVSGKPLAAMILDIRDGRIQTIYAIANPDKLRKVGEPATGSGLLVNCYSRRSRL